MKKLNELAEWASEGKLHQRLSKFILMLLPFILIGNIIYTLFDAFGVDTESLLAALFYAGLPFLGFGALMILMHLSNFNDGE